MMTDSVSLNLEKGFAVFIQSVLSLHTLTLHDGTISTNMTQL